VKRTWFESRDELIEEVVGREIGLEEAAWTP
jgi:hypothetical protein